MPLDILHDVFNSAFVTSMWCLKSEMLYDLFVKDSYCQENWYFLENDDFVLKQCFSFIAKLMF